MSAFVLVLALVLWGISNHVTEKRAALLEESRDLRLDLFIAEIDDVEFALCAHGEPTVPTHLVDANLQALRDKALRL